MSFGRAISAKELLDDILESGIYRDLSWYGTQKYDETFLKVWNAGKAMFKRCTNGQTPRREDFDIFYQEGKYSPIKLVYAGKEHIRENTTGHHLKERMQATFGTPYITCYEDIEILRDNFNILRAFLPIMERPIVVLECGKRNDDIKDMFSERKDITACFTESTDAESPIDYQVQTNCADVLIFNGPYSIQNTRRPRISIFMGVTKAQIPPFSEYLGHIISLSRSVHILIRYSFSMLYSSFQIGNLGGLIGAPVKQNIHDKCVESEVYNFFNGSCSWHLVNSKVSRFVELLEEFSKESEVPMYYLISRALTNLPKKNDFLIQSLKKKLETTDNLDDDVKNLLLNACEK